jgi:biopolymer transport protein ExbD
VRTSFAVPLALAVALPSGSCMKPAVKKPPTPVYITVDKTGAIHIGDKPYVAPESGSIR